MLILEIHERVADLVLVGQLQAVKRTRRSVAITSGQSCHRQRGGAVDYSAVLGNLGVALKPVEEREFYAASSQGFNLPDIGLQVRNARAGFHVGSSDLQPVKTNNYELGWRGAFGNTLGSLAMFYTTSDLGDVQRGSTTG